MQTLVVILGPTGVGKTDLCIDIANHLGCEIINCDSRQFFREIPIGTAAPTAEQQQQVRHYFVGNLSVDDYYSASEYEQDVLKFLQTQDKNANFVLTGGSMMYLDAVCNGIDCMPAVEEPIRNKLKIRLEEEGLDALLAELHELDPIHWNIVDKRNPRRILHALEICYQTGKPYSSFMRQEKPKRPFRVIKIGLTRPRAELFERINQRVLKMMDSGLEEEARKVWYKKGLNSLNTVGYKELFAYFDGEITKDEAIRQIQSNSRHYMKKQETWFKRDKDIKWFHPKEYKEIINYIDISLY
ncbi:MAG: tRNA (adenosine(37)-N6)-dimethylallyltransferase MiaA [Bacteroidales bacterium]|nr:tRNA (adenosine(37)-N6)-dimethylallyltransferase MiaA [Bacteroidales bacterium]MCM1147493.1 tRNA (adenosine(37)-N6)-dimethylallyltransferase MiaA [Bacteroidales bacterium]MCM1206162.1 tRNA (adenosine(37)-N6)-dimethylallyltransferase MiaA [Bacillota bacterium]MCM1510006.1 tRNA (adenosine(37)-N6)-dimethylallyltransferase MiaA [Clostridium sp.]